MGSGVYSPNFYFNMIASGDTSIDGKKKDEVIICECGMADHNIIFRYVDDGDHDYWDSVYMNIHLKTGGFWRRFIIAWKYLIWGTTSPYGEYDEVILPPDAETIKKIDGVVKYLKKIKKAQEQAKANSITV